MAEQIISKRCSRCKQVKPLSEFYKDKGRKDGHACGCKNCNMKSQKAYCLTEKGRKAVLRYVTSEKGHAASTRYVSSEKAYITRSQYQKSNKGKLTHKRYEQSLKGRKNRCAASHRHREKYPYQEPAKWAVKYAIETGKIPPPSECSCLICGQKARDYHHKSYAREHWLDVIPLCRQCHIDIHNGYGSVPSPP